MNKINSELVCKINNFFKNKKSPFVILICGVNGIGKTTLAFNLSSILDIKQRIGLGVIVKTLIANSSKRNYKKMIKMDNVFSIKTKELLKHETILRKTIDFIISKYITEKMSCIIEGLQLFGSYNNKNIIHFYIKVSDKNKYKNQLELCSTRSPRKLTKKDFDNIVLIDDFINKKMSERNVYVLENTLSETEMLNQSLQNIAEHFNIE